MIGFSPCGCVMDAIRYEYRRRCQFYNGQQVDTDIVWRFAAAGASYYTGRTVFWSYRGCEQIPPYTGPGEVYGSKVSYRRADIDTGPVQPGNAPDGTADDFLGLGVPPESVLVPGGTLPPPVCGTGPALALVGGELRPATSLIVRAGPAVSVAVGKPV